MDQTPGKSCIVQERVRWADVDLVGIMRFSAFTRIIELAEQELMRAAGLPYSELFVDPEVWLPRRQLSIEYLAPAKIDELLEIECYVSKIGETSAIYQVDVWNASGAMVATASLVVVCVTAAEFRKIPMVPEFRDALTPFVMTPEVARAARATAAR
jgi:YbgC/YbaW family acyl-CoA thioester hydrolase